MEKHHFYGHETAAVRDRYGYTPCEYYDLLSSIWCAETCAPRLRQEWTRENKTLGQCSITAFLLQDLFGGKVYGVPLDDGNFHCFNDVDGCVFDLTSEQFGEEKLSYENCPEQFRDVHFAKAEKRARYELLKKRLSDALAAVRDTVEEIVVDYGAYGEAAGARIDALMGKLSALDARECARWAEILKLWSSPTLGAPVTYGDLPDNLPDTDELCIAVLGYQLHRDGRMREEQIARLEIARKCADKYPRAYILCTGGGTAADNASASEAGEMAKWLFAHGISRERVIVEDRSMTTAQNARFSCGLLTSRYPAIKKLAVVTHDFHIPTVKLLFDAAAILYSDAPENAGFSVISSAAVKTSAPPLPRFFQAGALLELYGKREAAYDIYYGRYDLSKLPPIG